MSQNLDAAPRVLVLDGETRAALAVVRSLGKAGYHVAVASEKQHAIACASKWAGLTFRYPSPEVFPDRFIHWLSRTIELWQPRCILPVTDISLGLVLEYEQSFREVTVLPTVSKAAYDAVSDKAELTRVAQSLGVAAPKTVVVSTEMLAKDFLAEQLEGFSYPIVIKPRRSVQRSGAIVVKADVVYAQSFVAAWEILADAASEYAFPLEFLLQECVSGDGVGVFALCLRGEVLMSFAHQRILEKPPSGGRSVLSESLAPENAPMEESRALLAHYRWNGVAMVEFKRSSAGTCLLMEINPRFWGSLQLAIDAGRDFPRHLVDLACKPAGAEAAQNSIRNLAPYQLDLRLRWLLGTLDHFLIRCKQDPLVTLADLCRRNALQLFIRGKKTRFEVCRLGDIRPFLCECRVYLQTILGRAER